MLCLEMCNISALMYLDFAATCYVGVQVIPFPTLFQLSCLVQKLLV